MADALAADESYQARLARMLMGGVDPLTGANTEPSEAAQGKFGRIADAVAGGLRNWIETPGRAMKEGITTDQAVDWAAPTALGMVGAPGVPAGAVGSSLTRALATGDNAAIDAMKIAARERAERGGSTVRMFNTQQALDASRGLTQADQGAEKAKYGWQAARNDALAEFRAAMGDLEPKAAVPAEDALRGQFPIESGEPLNIPDKGLTAKDQMRLMDSLNNLGPTFGSGANNARGSAANLAIALNSEQPGIRAYHGSPYDFDRFDLSKIGTGEGAQAYGHGAYFAENEAVARQYRDNLGRNRALKDAAFNPDGSPNRQGMVAQHLDAGIDEARILDGLRALEPNASPAQINEYLTAGRKLFDKADKSGRMYEVNINAHPDQFLDWDKPLRDQPVAETVRSLVPQDIRKSFDYNVDKGNIPGSNAYYNYVPSQSFPIRDSAGTPWRASGAKSYEEALALVGGDPKLVNRLLTPDKAAAAATLNEAGIPGIKYLDQGSRAAGDGSRNFVVFSPEIISILRKYGVSSIAALPPAVQMGLALQGNGQPQQ